jgi:DNA polymerase-1
MAGKHPSIDMIIRYRELDTIATRYGTTLAKHVRQDGRIHGSFNIVGTETGRFSSAEPNLQNLPSRGSLAKIVKKVFVAPPGRVLLQLDYSQIEYRVAAIISGDRIMKQVFIDGGDLHRRTAELISMTAWGIPQDEMSSMDDAKIKPYRSAAKTTNFGLLYGLGVTTLARTLGIEVELARTINVSVMGAFVDLGRWLVDTVSFARAHGYVCGIVDGEEGRRPPLYSIASPDHGTVAHAVNQAKNTPIQGSAANYMARSLVETHSWLTADKIPARIVGTVHDSTIIEVDEDWAEEVAGMGIDIMESQWSDDIPLVVDCEVGRTWASLTAVQKDGNGELVWPTTIV